VASIGSTSSGRHATTRALGWLLGALLLAGTAHAEDARPATHAVGEVLVILAQPAEGPVDPSLSSLRALKEPPFNAYKSMKILSRSALELAQDQSFELDLPNGRWLRITLLERRADGRWKVQVSINRPNQKDYLRTLEVIASPGEPFFVAGQKYQGGTLVVGVRIGQRPARK
jgi:hypothetical protein